MYVFQKCDNMKMLQHVSLRGGYTFKECYKLTLYISYFFKLSLGKWSAFCHTNKYVQVKYKLFDEYDCFQKKTNVWNKSSLKMANGFRVTELLIYLKCLKNIA